MKAVYSMAEVVVKLKMSVDRVAINEYLGNTSTVKLEDGIRELLASLFDYQVYYCDRCGSAGRDEDRLNGTMEILEINNE